MHLISFNTHPARLSKNSEETQSKTIRSGIFFRLKKDSWTTQIPAAAFALDEIAFFCGKSLGARRVSNSTSGA